MFWLTTEQFSGLCHGVSNESLRVAAMSHLPVTDTLIPKKRRVSRVIAVVSVGANNLCIFVPCPCGLAMRSGIPPKTGNREQAGQCGPSERRGSCSQETPVTALGVHDSKCTFAQSRRALRARLDGRSNPHVSYRFLTSPHPYLRL